MLAKDYKTQLAAFTPESQEQMVAGLAQSAIMLAKFVGEKEINELLKKHGVDESLLTRPQPRPGKVRQFLQEMEQRRRRLATSIKNKSAFYAEAMPLFEKVASQWAKKTPVGSALQTLFEPQVDQSQGHSKLSNLQIRGDRAAGQQMLRVGKRGINVPIHFRRIQGRWYIEIV
jgi:hypothetical protein